MNKLKINIILLLVLAVASAGGKQLNLPEEYEELKNQAEKFYSEGSFSLSHELYLKAENMELSSIEKRWVAFRIADTLWRKEAATKTYDSTKYDIAYKKLEELVRDIQKDEEKDIIFAEVHESLGDFFWLRSDSKNWNEAWKYYQKCIDWWAGSKDLELAANRYIKIVWKLTQDGYYHGYIPLDILENVLKIVKTPDDKAKAHYLIAMFLRYRGEQSERVSGEFEKAIKPGKSVDWYDDALYHYAEWLSTYGNMIQLENGEIRYEQDYVKALELFKRILSEFEKGETRYYDHAKQQIENITKPIINVNVSNIFLPDSEIEFHLNWRNVKKIDFSLYKVDITKYLKFTSKNASIDNWVQYIDINLAEKIKSWTKETGDKGDYKPYNETIKLDKKLPLAAYILSANAEGVNARELILITDVSVVVKTSGKNALVYFCNAIDGAPISNGKVKLWKYYYNGSAYIWEENTKETNPDGIAVFEFNKKYESNIFISASINDRSAFSAGYSYYGYRDKEKEWRIYAFTDRPAYRPDETVQFKCIARKYDGAIYSTPANETIEFEITDQRGTKVKEGKLNLNAFGSAWGSLELISTMSLGEYRINFWNEKRQQNIGSAVLFRLEEYKLPEFKVKVEIPSEDGKKKAFKLGDKVEVIIKSDYYFGGPVSNATVNVIVYQNYFYHTWQAQREFPWFYEDISKASRHYWYGTEQIIKREVLKTDVNGKAILIFDTSKHSPQDFEYRIEARVVDSSRREIIGSGTVRVTKQSYYVYPKPEHNIYKPQDKVKINIKALDSNDEPVQVEGMVKVTRDFWIEKEKFRGYKHEEISSRIVKTNKDGESEVYFTPATEGYYRVIWNSKDKDGKQIKAETTVFVATKASNEFGYKHGGLEIIVDKDTFSVGQKAVCLLSVPASGSYVLFSIEGDDLYKYQLVHITGTVKLIEIPIEEKHVPNIFLNALMVNDSQIFIDTEQVIIPPKEHFLNVKVESDKEKYQPGEQGIFTITTADNNGKPVSSELALSLVDESVFYIQSDYAQDPRQFYYGTKRQDLIQTSSTFNYKSYKKREEEKKELDEEVDVIDQIVPKLRESGRRDKDESAIGSVQKNMVRGIASSLEAESKKESMLFDKSNIPGIPIQEPDVQVRTDFRTTIFWQPDIITDKDGKATVKVKFSDSLTTWKAFTRVATTGNKFGMGDYAVKSSKPLIVRLQAPRFFVNGDTVTISAVLNNNTDDNLTVVPVLTAEGVEILSNMSQPIKIKPNNEARADWVVSVSKHGYAKLKVIAKSEKYSDAMEKKYIIYEHGIEKFISKSGKIKEDERTIKLDIPKERKLESTNLFVQITPSLAVTMLDALPYLIDYPYGCTEQTMSRFIPAVITAKTLKELGLRPEDISNKIFGGIETEYVDKTHPEGKKNIYKLEEMVKQGLERIYDFQHSDSGWGWWKSGDGDHFMTSYVVWGLILADNAGINVKRNVIERGISYLDKEIVEEESNYDMQAWMLYVLSTKQRGISKFQQKAFENLWKNKDKLNAYTRSLFALTSHNFGYLEKAKILIQNLENGVKIDVEAKTAHWGADGIYYRWSDGGIEATAFALKAFLAIDPENKLIESIVNWLIKGRRGAQWSNTRDTAITILALNDYLKESKELSSELEYELFVNGNFITRKKITQKDILNAPCKFVIEQKFIKDGENEIRIVRKSGNSPIYFSANAKFFSLEEPIKQAGNEIFVNRKYYRLIAKPTLLKGYVHEKKLLNDKDEIKSGDRIETVITISAKNNYEYLVFEDLKPAGIESVQIRSGEQLYAKELKENKDYTGRTKWVYQEIRDRKVALFIDKLPEGTWEIRYEMRAEVPGSFHGLPTIGYAMYVPEIRCNDTEIRIRVSDNQ